MFKKLLLPSIFLILTYGFWVSPDFKQISAGVAIFLFGMLSLEQVGLFMLRDLLASF